MNFIKKIKFEKSSIKPHGVKDKNTCNPLIFLIYIYCIMYVLIKTINMFNIIY